MPDKKTQTHHQIRPKRDIVKWLDHLEQKPSKTISDWTVISVLKWIIMENDAERLT